MCVAPVKLVATSTRATDPADASRGKNVSERVRGKALTAGAGLPAAMTLRVGLLGAGVMGRNHARVLAEMGCLAGVADADRAAAAHVAERWRVPRREGLDALLKDVDALVVATPTVTHVDAARAALEAGKHVLVEKPIARTQAEARDLVRIAEKAGRVLAVGHVERHNPVVRWVKDALASGRVGEPISIHSRRLSPYPERIRDVGVVLDIAIHDLDIALHLAPGAPRGVYALAGAHRRDAGVEDHASILVDFADGVDAFSETSWLTPTKVRSLTVTCAGGVIGADYMTQEVTVSRARFGDIDPDNLFQVPVEHTVERMALRKEEPLKNEHLDFQRAIREGKRPLADGRDGLAALALAEAALESARKGTRVPLEAGA